MHNLFKWERINWLKNMFASFSEELLSLEDIFTFLRTCLASIPFILVYILEWGLCWCPSSWLNVVEREDREYWIICRSCTDGIYQKNYLSEEFQVLFSNTKPWNHVYIFEMLALINIVLTKNSDRRKIRIEFWKLESTSCHNYIP